MSARRVQALMHGSRKGEDGVVWHREHRSPDRRSPKGANRRMQVAWKRGGKYNQKLLEQSKKIAWRTARFDEWKKAHPTFQNKDNPFSLPRKEFKANIMLEAFQRAGLV